MRFLARKPLVAAIALVVGFLVAGCGDSKTSKSTAPPSTSTSSGKPDVSQIMAFVKSDLTKQTHSARVTSVKCTIGDGAKTGTCRVVETPSRGGRPVTVTAHVTVTRATGAIKYSCPDCLF